RHSRGSGMQEEAETKEREEKGIGTRRQEEQVTAIDRDNKHDMASTTTALITQNSSTPLALPGTASQKDAEAAAAPTSEAQSTSPSKRGFFSSFRKKKRDKDKKEQEGKGRGGGAAAA